MVLSLAVTSERLAGATAGASRSLASGMRRPKSRASFSVLPCGSSSLDSA